MARKTYLQLVNSVLTKLREDTVTTVSKNKYSRLIGEFINEAKREVEDAHAWNALKDSISISTTASAFSYSLTDAGQRSFIIDAYNQTSETRMHVISTAQMNKLVIVTQDTGEPLWFNVNGTDSNGDMSVDVYPIPNAVYALYFNLIIPQADLSNDSDEILIPHEPVVLNAYARAVVERGEDGGIMSNEAYALYKKSLANHISTEQGNQPDELIWTPK